MDDFLPHNLTLAVSLFFFCWCWGLMLLLSLLLEVVIVADVSGVVVSGGVFGGGCVVAKITTIF